MNTDDDEITLFPSAAGVMVILYPPRVKVQSPERRALQGIDDDFHDIMPPCLAGMGCLCAGHARGDAPQVRCDTNEEPGDRPEGRTPTLATAAAIVVDLALTPSRAQWRELAHAAEVNDRRKAALTVGSSRTTKTLLTRGWVTHKPRDGYWITAVGRAALARADKRYRKHLGAS